MLEQSYKLNWANTGPFLDLLIYHFGQETKVYWEKNIAYKLRRSGKKQKALFLSGCVFSPTNAWQQPICLSFKEDFTTTLKQILERFSVTIELISVVVSNIPQTIPWTMKQNAALFGQLSCPQRLLRLWENLEHHHRNTFFILSILSTTLLHCAYTIHSWMWREWKTPANSYTATDLLYMSHFSGD